MTKRPKRDAPRTGAEASAARSEATEAVAAAPEDVRVPGLIGWTRPAHWPAFTAGWPRDAALEALVEAFARGDHRHVREEAPRLAERAVDDEVRRCARELRARIDPDPTGKVLIVIAAVLLAFLAWWYLFHSHGPA